MTSLLKKSILAAFVLLVLPLSAFAIVEKDTGTEYPDEITIGTGDESFTMTVTGVGLREKTFLKVDVYTIVSYVRTGVTLEGDKGEAIRTLTDAKRLQMDLRRGFSREKLLKAFTEVIHKNYDDTSAFDADMEIFSAYFTRDAEDRDQILIDYCPVGGLTTTLNGEIKGVIKSAAFVEALWSVWFGEKPANKGLKEAMLSAL